MDNQSQAHVAKFLRMEGNLSNLLRDVDKLKSLCAQHGSKIREMHVGLTNTVSNAEFMSAMTATRFQQLNVSKHMQATGKGEEDPLDMYGNSDKESKEVKILRTQ